jgi:predicted nucleic acid-binding protein
MNALFDTKMFVYPVSKASIDKRKRELAISLISESEVHLSLQVVQEFIPTCLRKKHIGRDSGALALLTLRMLEFPCVQPTPDIIFAALEIHNRHGISYWDAAILAAAQELDCDTLYTEDLNHGQIYGTVRVVNSFL